MTEEQARESGADIQVVTLPVAAIPRARVMNRYPWGIKSDC